jgi:hypothetical protein
VSSTTLTVALKKSEKPGEAAAEQKVAWWARV